MGEILLGNIFKRNAKTKISLRRVSQNSPFVSMNIEDLSSFFSERGEDCVFIDGPVDSEYLQKIAIDEGFLRSFLF
ncbi:MAG: hypothetical protein PHD38_09560, partial [Mesotoga sp.]|nr:hypothetical protein [Mesotoga sp.]